MFSKKNHELSASIEQDFRPDYITQVGFSGTITAMAYDPVQALYAVGTDLGMVHVLGAGEIRVLFDTNPAHKTPNVAVKFLRFVTSVYLIAITERSTIIVYSLDTKTEWSTYQSPFSVMSCFTDPAMDWLLLGHNNGEVTGFDIDQGRPTFFKLTNLEKIVDPKVLGGSVFSLSIHPRDPALLLLCYRTVAVVWNIVKQEIVCDLHYEFPFTYTTWHPSGSHIASSHVNGMLVFWDPSKGVKLGARHAFPSLVNTLDTTSDRVPEGLAWCCKEDPTDTYLIVWGGSQISMMEFGPTPTVATSSYEYMGNFYKSEALNLFEIKFTSPIRMVQICPKVGVPHFQGCYYPTHAVVCCGDGIVKPKPMAGVDTLGGSVDSKFQLPNNAPRCELAVLNLPQMQLTPMVSAVLPPALCWRSSVMTCLTTVSIARNQWIGMMAAAQPNMKVIGGKSSTQRMRKLQLSTVLCMGCLDGSVKLFDGTRADSQDYRVVMTTVQGLGDSTKVTHVSLGTEVGEMAISTSNGDVYLASFGKNHHPSEPLPPPPDSGIENIEHLVSKELSQGFIPQFKYLGKEPVTALCHSNVGFVAFGTHTGKVICIDRRGPAVIFETSISGTASCLDFGIVTLGSDNYASIVLAVGTSHGSIMMYKIIPRQGGGFEVELKPKLKELSVGKDPVQTLMFIDQGKGKSSRATPEVMNRLASGMQVNGAILATTTSDARFFALSGPKIGKKLGSKSFDTPILSASYTWLRFGTSSALVTINTKGKCAIYGLPSLGTLCSYQALATPGGANASVSEMGDIFIPYDNEAHAGQVMRVFGTDHRPLDDDVYQLLRKVPARPVISTAHWVAGRQFVKVSDLDKVMAGNRRGKHRRPHHQLIDTEPVSEPQTTAEKPPKGFFGSKALPKFDHPARKSRILPKKTWGQTFHEYYESAEGAVNDALDDAMESMNTGGKQARSSAMKGVMSKTLGF